MNTKKYRLNRGDFFVVKSMFSTGWAIESRIDSTQPIIVEILEDWSWIRDLSHPIQNTTDYLYTQTKCRFHNFNGKTEQHYPALWLLESSMTSPVYFVKVKSLEEAQFLSI